MLLSTKAEVIALLTFIMILFLILMMRCIFFSSPWSCCATQLLFEVPRALIANEDSPVVGMGVKCSSWVNISYKPDSRVLACLTVQYLTKLKSAEKKKRKKKKTNSGIFLVFTEVVKFYFLFSLMDKTLLQSVYQLFINSAPQCFCHLEKCFGMLNIRFPFSFSWCHPNFA